MIQRRRFRGIWVVLIWLGLGCGPALSALGDQSTIRCEDGEFFRLETQVTADSQAISDAAGDKIVVDTGKLRLDYYQNGVLVKSYTVAIGTGKTPSPIGEWKIIHKGGSWGGGFGARWLGINVPWGIYGIHGTNKPGSIGSRSSHGCIRMFNPQVIELYKMVKVGTPVFILGDPPKVKIRSELRRKSTGRDVLRVQFAMRRAGFDPGFADARYGETMERAVKRMQFHYGLAPTGVLTPVELFLLGLEAW